MTQRIDSSDYYPRVGSASESPKGSNVVLKPSMGGSVEKDLRTEGQLQRI